MTLTENQIYAIAIGPSIGGACILFAAIILAVACCLKERKKRKKCSQESVSSDVSLFREFRGFNPFRFPVFSTAQKSGKSEEFSGSPQSWRTASESNQIYTVQVDKKSVFPHSPQSVQPFVRPPPIKPSADNTLSTTLTAATFTLDDDSNKTITEKFYYNFGKNIKPTDTSTQDDADKLQEVVVRNKTRPKSRDVSHISTDVLPSRKTVISEDVWNSTVDEMFNSALSVHEHENINCIMPSRISVYPQ